MLAQILIAATIGTVCAPTAAGDEPGNVESASPKTTVLGGPVVSVPMDSWGPRPVVLAKINGKGPFRFHLDTGTSVPIVLDKQLVAELGIPLTAGKQTDLPMPDGGEVEVGIVAIGDARFSRIRGSVSDLRGFMQGLPGAPDGILGLPLFEDCLLTLDYPEREVRLETGELAAPDGETIEYSADRQHDYGVTIELSVAGTPVKAHLDTGSPGFISLLSEWQEKLPLKGKPRVVGMARTPEGSSEVRAATLDGIVKMGRHEFTDPDIDFVDLGPMKRYGAGNIGSRLLRQFAVTVDQKNRRVRFRRPGES